MFDSPRLFWLNCLWFSVDLKTESEDDDKERKLNCSLNAFNYKIEFLSGENNGGSGCSLNASQYHTLKLKCLRVSSQGG